MLILEILTSLFW